MVAKKKPAVKRKPAAKKPVSKARAEIDQLGRPRAEIHQLDRIEKTLKRILNVVEFLEAEIIKARDADSVDGETEIAETPFEEGT